MSKNFVFRSEDHSYHVDGHRLPSVSEIIKPLSNFDGIDPVVLERKRELGTQVHFATSLDDEGELDDDDTDDVVLGYVRGWRAFKRDTGFTILMNEQKLYHPTLRYAGTLDRLGDTRGGERLVIDLKTSVCMTSSFGVQLAGYRLLIEANNPLLLRRIKRKGLQLRPDGTYRLIPYDNPSDVPCFRALLSVWNWTENMQ